jgi:uncharacterized MAPEG superfamily protein
MHLHAALVTALTAVLLTFVTVLVGRARGKHGVHAPATTGHPDFERVFRAQANTIEQVVAFLPVLWLATLYSDERIAAGLGYAWLAGRFWYVLGYARDAQKRSAGFLLGALAFMGLLGMALWGIGKGLLAG